MSTFKAVVLKGAKQVKNDGTTNIKIRVTHKRKDAYISTKLYIPVNNFDNKKGIATGQNAEHLNLKIGITINEYRLKDINLGQNREYMTVTDIKNHLLTNTGKTLDFFEFTKDLLKITQNPGTRNQYEALAASLEKFNGPKLSFSNINLIFLQRYELYLRNRGAKNGIINYMVTFRAMYNKARDLHNDEDTGQIRIPNYPFKKYRMPKREQNSREHTLTPSELQKLIKYAPINPGEQFAKDMFLLMVYLIGIEAKDLFYLPAPVRGRVKYQRFKTGGEFSIKLEPPALEIIKRYKSKTHLLNVSERFLHHKSFYRYVNNYLKGERAHQITGLFTRLGINKPVTTKWARHTWATIARNNCEIDKSTVALCLGHTDPDNRVTDMYIKPDTRLIDKTNRKVLDFIDKKNK